MKLRITTDQGFSYELPISCLKYSRVTNNWVFFSKKVTRRKAIAIPGEIAESLLRAEKLITRHDRGDYVLFQVNGNSLFDHGIVFDPQKHL